MTAQFGQYNGTIGVTTSSLNGTWGSAYNMFANVDFMEETSAGNSRRWFTLSRRCGSNHGGLHLHFFSRLRR